MQDRAPGRAAPAPRVLLVDDDVALGEMMRRVFSRNGFRLDVAHDGRRGLDRCRRDDYALVLLDVMLPGLDGLEVLRRLRRESTVPVIIVTARGGREDRVLGLDAGADDYLPKPFGTEELLARVRAVLRRAEPSPSRPEPVVAGGLRLDPGSRAASLDGAGLDLTAFEFDILLHLARQAGRVVPRHELMARIYQRRASPQDRALDMHISNLRKKMGTGGERLRTVRGVGFLLAEAG